MMPVTLTPHATHTHTHHHTDTLQKSTVFSLVLQPPLCRLECPYSSYQHLRVLSFSLLHSCRPLGMHPHRPLAFPSPFGWVFMGGRSGCQSTARHLRHGSPRLPGGPDNNGLLFRPVYPARCATSVFHSGMLSPRWVYMGHPRWLLCSRWSFVPRR